MEVEKKKWDTISVSTTPMIRERIDYIRKYLGINSRSAAIALVINEVYDRLVESGRQTKLEQRLMNEID